MIKRIFNVLLVLGKVILMGLILYDFYSSLHNGAPLSLNLEGLKASLLVYYLPLSVISLLILWFMKNRKTFTKPIVFDFSIIFVCMIL